MNIQEIKKKLDSAEYDFLRNTPELGDNIILLTLGGSHAYGTDIPGKSDLDIRGITLNSKKEILTMKCREKPFENKITDTTVYTLKQIIYLLTNANPNTIEMLGTKEEHLFVCNKYGKMLRENSNMFLSKKVISSFYGYATQQLRRLENALCHDSYPQWEKEKHIKKSIEKQIMTMNNRYIDFSDKELKIYLDKSKKEGYDQELFVDYNFNHYPLRDFKNIYSEMSQIVNDYDKLNKRNNKKDETHLLKHSMHLIRLFLMAIDILSNKGINTYREKDRTLLLDIRNGKYTYKEIFEMVNVLEKEFNYAKENTNLPDEPDYNMIDEIISYINHDIINNFYIIEE